MNKISDSEGAETFKDKIEGLTKINFSVSSCPKPLYDEFKVICKKDFSDTYHLALRYFIDLYNGRKELDNIWDVIHKHSSRFVELEAKFEELVFVDSPVVEEHDKKEEGREILTFGKKKDLEEE